MIEGYKIPNIIFNTREDEQKIKSIGGKSIIGL